MSSFGKIQSWEIDKILDRRNVGGKVRYLVKWRRFCESNTWEPCERFENVRHIVEDFENKVNQICNNHHRMTPERRRVSNTIMKPTVTKVARPSLAKSVQLSKMSSVNSEKTFSKKNRIEEQILFIMEDEFHCSICHDIVQDASITECEHCFCSKCIKEWKSIKESCPVCRKYLFSSEVKVPAINSFISRVKGVLKEHDPYD